MQSDFKPFRLKSKKIDSEPTISAPQLTTQEPPTTFPETSPVSRTAELPPGPRETQRPNGPKSTSFMDFSWTFNRKTTLLLTATTLLLVGGGLFAVLQTRSSDMGGTYISKRPPKPVVKPTTVASNLSGLQIQPEVNERPVTGVMIENSLDARPQSGLDQAGVVFEAIAEGGITRFMALFQDTQPDHLGPVRSVRPYYAQWCMSFDCALAHAGGSPEALANIRSWGTKDLDQFANNAPYVRITDRYAPHNLYTSVAKLRELETAKGYGKANFTPLVRKAAAPSKTPSATKINVAISSYAFNSSYSYDSISNTYARSQNGSAHHVVDAGGQQTQLRPTVIVALTLPYSIASDKHSQYGVVGSGEARVFQDGVVTTGTWAKPDVSAPLTLTGADGQPLALNPGQTWFVAVSGSHLVTYN
ncbi:MAG: DUF3048 domain-containing protein [Candidatus Saccharimonadales bacterium]